MRADSGYYCSGKKITVQKLVQLIFDIFKSLVDLPVTLDSLVPHRCGAHPEFTLSVQRTVDDHFFECFGVFCRSYDLIHIAFEVAVSAFSDTHI